ncbi:BirA family biotin operon repressor/biotin-[acetyl-CoA-carboxylase] ligase [Desulfomicrobium macestii]|uniref:BirA family biotin operon repressor/biotin-[acetyl-CoA-carboxylase] ligase n=1 Tax=Desulfomicrobium macestii TaxID=90731 RepID=A0ABR9H320_9BACT|nr:biotin--[acetyl-CoA-carboxylase] ligase [Desulfomicrobium macestii]MBE1424963.1 BirA family biotin operon repressor/biotin-[acetyl-CoA-carboxylase] ligase [Desulfomicrobium macestii]
MPILWTPDIEGVTDAFSADHADASAILGPGEPCADRPDERVYLCGPCSSALDVAGYLAGQGCLDPWDSVLSTRQWAGRGQMRRTWISQPGNLFAAWRLPMPPSSWQNMLSVLVGWVMCRGLGELGVPVTLKWPNDILLHGRKIGGILIEERGDVLLAGIGLNIASCPEDADLRRDHACVAANLGGLLRGVSIFGLWLRLVNFGRLRYSTELSDSTPLEFSQLIEPVLAYLGALVRVSDNRSSVCGTYAGVSPDGGIVLLADGERRVLHSGSLRPEGWSEGQI